MIGFGGGKGPASTFYGLFWVLIPIDRLLPDLFSANLGHKRRTQSVPPETNGFMANLDSALMQKVFGIRWQQRKPNVHCHRQAS